MVLLQCALVRAAIVHIKKQYQGASLVQIRKHLESTYEEKLDAKKKKLIHNTFKNLVQEGKFLRRGTMYKFAKKQVTPNGNETTKKRAIVEHFDESSKKQEIEHSEVPQRHHRRHHHRRHHQKRHHSRRRHHRRRHHRRRHHKKRHHKRRRHHRRRHHKSRQYHRRKYHGQRHHRIKVHRSNKRTFTHIHHSQGVSGNPSIDVPVDKLTLSPLVAKALE